MSENPRTPDTVASLEQERPTFEPIAATVPLKRRGQNQDREQFLAYRLTGGRVNLIPGHYPQELPFKRGERVITYVRTKDYVMRIDSDGKITTLDLRALKNGRVRYEANPIANYLTSASITLGENFEATAAQAPAQDETGNLLTQAWTDLFTLPESHIEEVLFRTSRPAPEGIPTTDTAHLIGRPSDFLPQPKPEAPKNPEEILGEAVDRVVVLMHGDQMAAALGAIDGKDPADTLASRNEVWKEAAKHYPDYKARISQLRLVTVLPLLHQTLSRRFSAVRDTDARRLLAQVDEYRIMSSDHPNRDGRKEADRMAVELGLGQGIWRKGWRNPRAHDLTLQDVVKAILQGNLSVEYRSKQSN